MGVEEGGRMDLLCVWIMYLVCHLYMPGRGCSGPLPVGNSGLRCCVHVTSFER